MKFCSFGIPPSSNKSINQADSTATSIRHLGRIYKDRKKAKATLKYLKWQNWTNEEWNSLTWGDTIGKKIGPGHRQKNGTINHTRHLCCVYPGIQMFFTKCVTSLELFYTWLKRNKHKWDSPKLCRQNIFSYFPESFLVPSIFSEAIKSEFQIKLPLKKYWKT